MSESEIGRADVRTIRNGLEGRKLNLDAAIGRLAELAHGGGTRAVRVGAYRALGEIAGRAHDATWEHAEKAAWVLLACTGHVDAPAERRGLLLAMGRAFRNVWLMPFVHSRLDDEEAVMATAIAAAGGLGFAGLEEALASRFLNPEASPALRLAAIQALGHMGASSAAGRLVPFIHESAAAPQEAAAALGALTEIRSPVGVEAAVAVLERDPEREVLLAGIRYLAEMGRVEVIPHLRRLAREDDAELRLEAGLASRAFKAEQARDPGERILIALTERDRMVRAVLARRLRGLPVAEVLEQAEMLLGDDPAGVVQILGEVRTPEVSRFLLALSARTDLDDLVRARALSAVEADEPWERDALAAVIADPARGERVRAAAAQTMGAFARLPELFAKLGPLTDDPSPLIRGAFLWALQLGAHPTRMSPDERKRCEEAMSRGLADPDVAVRRRAAYVVGNLGLSALAPQLIAMAKQETERPELRVAAFVGLTELGQPAVFTDLLALLRREEHPDAVAAASRAVAATVLAARAATARGENAPKLEFDHLAGKLAAMLKADDAVVRGAAVRLAGLAGGAVPAAALLPLMEDGNARVREQAITALGRLGATEAEAPLLAALEDPDPGVHERAAEALLSLPGRKVLDKLLAWVSGEGDAEARQAVAARITVPAAEREAVLPLVSAALERLEVTDPTYEALIELKLKLLESAPRAAGGGATAGATAAQTSVNVDAAIIALFPTYAQLGKVRGFEPLGRSLRTAEALYHTATGLADADLSPPIVLWMKTLEGYTHAWLSGKMLNLQKDPMSLYAYVDGVLGDAWPTYQRFIHDRWSDNVDMGKTRVELPLRSVPNALRDYQERRPRRLDSPLSVTDWARIMLFFAVDHPAGVRNLFKVAGKNADTVVRLCHRLHTLAAVRNVVTHRAAAGSATLEAFRKAYYQAFEDLTKLAG